MLASRITTLYFLTTVNICSKVSSTVRLHHCTVTKNWKAFYSDKNKSVMQCAMGTHNSKSRGSPAREDPKAKTLDDFGYHLVEVDGMTRLRAKDNNEQPFEFDVYNGDRNRNQERYEAIGEVITKLVYQRLQEEPIKLEKVTIPVNAKDREGKGFFFKSTDALHADKLLILIHGSGVVRAGQWARSLIINDSWESGTMEPYIIQAQQQGFGIIITNGNHNFDPITKKTIKGSENPQHHMLYVWKTFLEDCKAKDIAVVAHSFGGIVVHHLVRTISSSSRERIKAVAFTDSVHSMRNSESNDIKEWFKKTTRNWISSTMPLDEPITSYSNSNCELVSAGTDEHVWTSCRAKDSVFKFIHEKLHDPSKCTEAAESPTKEDIDNTDNNGRTKVPVGDNAAEEKPEINENEENEENIK